MPFIDTIGIGMTREYMTADQRFAVHAARRAGLSDRRSMADDLTLAGPIEVDLYVSTTGTDADWVVKLIDVYPDDAPDPDPNPTSVQDGRLPAAGARRAVPRQVPQQLSKPEPFEPGQPHAGSSSRCRTCYHTFRQGHRIMVQVQSTWFPLVDRNPQTFVDIYTATRGRLPKGDAPRLRRLARHL